MKQPEFTSLEMNITIPSLLRFWAKKFPCSNVHWITRDTFARMKNVAPDAWKWNVDAEQSVQSHKPASLDRLFEVWHQISLMPSGKTSSRPTLIQRADKANVLCPIKGPQTGEILGYILFEALVGKVTPKRLSAIKSAVVPHSRHLEFCWQYQQSKAQSFHDDLTSLYNQRYLPVVFEREINRMERLNKQFTVLFMDIDFFKKVNDSRGHWTGSALLKDVSKIILDCTRACDYAFRYGGDEFLVVLVDTSPENGQKVAERIRSRIEQNDFEIEGHNLKLTVSIGLACYPVHAQSTVELIQLADQAMYYGKNKSRNIVFCAG
jgi:diguanylate cyclase (GGDEF)-like protein